MKEVSCIILQFSPRPRQSSTCRVPIVVGLVILTNPPDCFKSIEITFDVPFKLPANMFKQSSFFVICAKVLCVAVFDNGE